MITDEHNQGAIRFAGVLVALALVTILMSRIKLHDWRTGVMLLGIYGGFFIVMLVF